MPEEWSVEAESRAPEQAQKYKELQQKLVELNEKRKISREKLENYEKFRELLVPFGEQGDVQSNLVTKNGEVEEELEKMRRLMLRVERGLGVLEEKNTGDEMDIDLEESNERKVLNLLGGS